MVNTTQTLNYLVEQVRVSNELPFGLSQWVIPFGRKKEEEKEALWEH